MPTTPEEYKKNYQASLASPEKYWAEQAQKFLTWKQPWAKVRDYSFSADNVHIRWFEGGTLNVSENCLDRHLKDKANQPAIIWEPDSPDEKNRVLTYRELHAAVCRTANMLKKLGVTSKDIVTLYMPMVPEAAIAMLACARIGAAHSVIFGGFSPHAIRGRLEDSKSTLLITADEGMRGGKRIPLKANVDEALSSLPRRGRVGVGTLDAQNMLSPPPNLPPTGGGIENIQVLVLKRTGGAIDWNESRDIWWHELEKTVDDDCPAEAFDAEHPLFLLYTSGSTGKPKGVVHSSAGYLLWSTMTFQHVFDYQPGDIYWCTADVGWITGHSYIVYGPLAAGATTLMFEGVPTYPDASRFWRIVDKYIVNQFYTAPTALRMLMHEGDAHVKSSSRASLRVLGSVGEPINPEVWLWFRDVVGNGKAEVVDTWWQTETGGHLITPIPGAIPTKPGSATLPFFGVKPALLKAGNVPPPEGGRLGGGDWPPGQATSNPQHIRPVGDHPHLASPLQGEEKEITGPGEGALCIAESWPGQARTIFGDHARFIETYFKPFPGYYFSGDAASRDEDGYYWLQGRMDDVLNVSGHRIGTAEVESSLVAHAAVTEAAVVGYPHDIKGEGIYAYVMLKPDAVASDALKKELQQWVRKDIGPLAQPEKIHFTPGLPKTRSGKIMRRILRKIAAGDIQTREDLSKLGDITTLLNPEIVEELVKGKA